MGRTGFIAIFVIGVLTPRLLAQNRPVVAHFDVVRAGGKAKSKGAADVVLWLSPVGVAVPTHPTPPGRAPQLVQKNKAFSPHLLVIPAGSWVEFPNHDPFFHNVFSLFEGKRFDLGLYEAGGSRMVRFDRPGVSYVFCNIHPEMSAMIVVVDTPYYAVSRENGEVAIPDVPSGTYVMHVWSEFSKPQELQALMRQVSVSDSDRFLGNLHLTETPGLWSAHSNKYGQTYETPNPSSPIYVQPQ